MPNQALWQPNDATIAHSRMNHFIEFIRSRCNMSVDDYPALHQWSIDNPVLFWRLLWQYFEIRGKCDEASVFQAAERIEDGVWFNDSTLNFTNNLLSRDDAQPALLFENELGLKQQVSFQELNNAVANLAHELKSLGLKKGDTVVAVLPNCPSAIIAMLATAALGAVFSSCSPDFGLSALTDRFMQLKPTILFAVDGFHYAGRHMTILDKVAQLQHQLPTLTHTFIAPYLVDAPDLQSLQQATLWEYNTRSTNRLSFVDHEFNHPLVVLFSSGTTGKPKRLVHGAGGTLIQHLKELALHSDIHKNDRLFFYTTTGWMMWNWLASALALGATIVLYDGSPNYPNPSRLYNLIEAYDITHFGLGARLVETHERAKLFPSRSHDLHSLRCLLTTGSPLLPASFDWVYSHVKEDIQLSSISGGSDIISCFALGNPLLPVYRGELQCAGLGMDVKVFNDRGQAVVEQEGELVCCHSFPSMPLNRQGASYFSEYDNVWTHGDYAKVTCHGGIVIKGRSDATLNPGGVRVGTAEIYQQVRQFDQVLDCVAIGQTWQGSERILLFVVMRPGQPLDRQLIQAIKKSIKEHTSRHHVPSKIIAVPDLPRTLSNKVVEVAVKRVIHGQEVTNADALANPESLDYFRNIPELQKRDG